MALAPPPPQFSEAERKDGRAFREILTSFVAAWSAAKFQQMIERGTALKPAVLWQVLYENPLTRLACNLATQRVGEDPPRYLNAVTPALMLDQISIVRPDLVPVASSPAGYAWLAYFTDGFKQVVCEAATGHNGYVVREGDTVRCTLCGKSLKVK